MGHFIYDSAVIGFYLAILVSSAQLNPGIKWKKVWPWYLTLTAWPLFVALIPMQHYLVQLVGLRGNIFFLPMILIGLIMDSRCRSLFTYELAILNIVSFGFALAEYYLGVETFVPENEATFIVFNSNDVAGGNKRIPSIFANAHSYAGTMVSTLPWLVGEIIVGKKFRIQNIVLILGVIFGLLGVFIAGPRSPVVILGLLVFLIVFSGRISFGLILFMSIIGVVVSYFVSQDERMQRFSELQDIESVMWRINGSLNMSFFDVLFDYPMGNGMGGGGTSLPGFAQGLLKQQVMLENEYARILLEQGLPGLLLWVGFIVWFFLQRISLDDSARLSKTLLWFLTAIYFSTAWIGVGLMTSVPHTTLLFLGLGYSISKTNFSYLKSKANILVGKNEPLEQKNLPAYQRGLAQIL
jgi:hypothetical protein